MSVAERSPDDVSDWGAWMIESAGGGCPLPSEALSTLLVELDGISEAQVDLGRYLGQITPLGKDIESAKAEAVRIMTMASAKELTVQATVVAALENDVIPRHGVDPQEERRLLYVAQTFNDGCLLHVGPHPDGAGRAGVGAPQRFTAVTEFLRDGPVGSEGGAAFVSARWPAR